MLVRSQDRNVEVNLNRATTIFIKENITTKAFEIRVYTGNTYVTDVLGQYSTEEKAQKVLDTIEEAYVEQSPILYMPEES